MNSNEQWPLAPIVIESMNAKDMTATEIDELSAAIQLALREDGQELAVVGVAEEPFGVGNTWTDVLNVFVPSVDFIRTEIYTAMIAVGVAFMRRRFAKKHESGRPREIVVRVHDGEVVDVIRLESSEGEPERRELDAAAQRESPRAGRFDWARRPFDQEESDSD